jgi:hypothetical protein
MSKISVRPLDFYYGAVKTLVGVSMEVAATAPALHHRHRHPQHAAGRRPTANSILIYGSFALDKGLKPLVESEAN